jgi:hypothetical protein
LVSDEIVKKITVLGNTLEIIKNGEFSWPPQPYGQLQGYGSNFFFVTFLLMYLILNNLLEEIVSDENDQHEHSDSNFEKSPF